ncbi:hypothetical protein, partial [Mycolicibacter sinensis]
FASFQGTATWTDGVNVHLTYSSSDSGLGGETTLNAAAPMLISPSSDVFMKIPMAWVDLAMKIIAFLNGLDSVPLSGGLRIWRGSRVAINESC